ncbi:MAG: peptidylprolyl isomerase [Clostridiales bacterium]|nr:peptidylprolyl isomerase [Clostridiales bacterium]
MDISFFGGLLVITKVPVATIEMQNGSVIKLELYYDIAPNTVKNFVHLANKGFYDGTIFHRVVKNFVIQGGDPTGTGTGGPGYRIKGEFSNNKHNNPLSHERGVVSMARQGNPYNPPAAYDTAGSQFFILHADAKYLDKDYAAFGMVVEGMDAVDAIATCVTGVNSKPVVEQKIKSVRVDTFGETLEAPETIAE